MTTSKLDNTLRQIGIPAVVGQAKEDTLVRALSSGSAPVGEQSNLHRLPRLGFVFEGQGAAAYQRWVDTQSTDERDAATAHFRDAFICWRALASFEQTSNSADPAGSTDSVSDLLQRELLDEPVPPYLGLPFRIAVSGVAGESSAETRLELKRFLSGPVSVDLDWRQQVLHHVFSAVVYLVRKAGGWDDVDHALASINRLRELQQQHEEAYLDNAPGEPSRALFELVGLYHLAQMTTIAGDYLRDGSAAASGVHVRIDRHRDRANAAFRNAYEPHLAHFADLLWIGTRELVQNSIWTHVAGLGEDARDLARVLASRGRPCPVIELWPSQQDALKRNLLDPYRRAILVEMPTSAGKTLLAEFALVQTHALNPNGTIAYVVPTRALVNQVTVELRNDLRGLGIRVEQTVPVFELDRV